MQDVREQVEFNRRRSAEATHSVDRQEFEQTVLDHLGGLQQVVKALAAHVGASHLLDPGGPDGDQPPTLCGEVADLAAKVEQRTADGTLLHTAAADGKALATLAGEAAALTKAVEAALAR